MIAEDETAWIHNLETDEKIPMNLHELLAHEHDEDCCCDACNGKD